jgi:hypothetical protein
MNYSIMIAAAFILATIAVAAMSPFDHLPQGAPQETAANAPSDGASSDDSSLDESGSSMSNSGSNIRGHWEPGEAPPQ